MKLRSELLPFGLAVLMLAWPAPVAGQSNQQELIRGTLLEGKAKRDVAIQRCAASAAQAYRFASFDVIGFEYPGNGGIRVHAQVNPQSVGSRFELSCDVDRRGNLRRLDFGRTG